VSVKVIARDPVEIVGLGPGEVSGTGYAFTLQFENSGTESISLDSVLVVATYGPEKVPASDSRLDPTRPVAGVLGPGMSAQGTYSFLIPKSASDAVILTITYSTDRPAVVVEI
jgi:hypothetical protein